MLSFDDWEEQSIQWLKEEVIEWYLENEDREPTEREIEQGIQDRSERNYERQFANYWGG